MNRIHIFTLLLLSLTLSLSAQEKQEDLKREVTLYNPYKPSLPPVKKRSFFADINDTLKVTEDFAYDISTNPFSPEYKISPIKAATLLPDPLTKLYKTYVNLGIGNYLTPLAEISLTNERSKRSSYGLYARHFSTNGRVKLDNDKRVFAGYMDNDVSLFGKKFFRDNYLKGTIDYSQKMRFAYGYDPGISDYVPKNENIRTGNNNLSSDISFSSLNLDSTDFSYDFNAHYDLFFQGEKRYQHNTGLTGTMSKSHRGYYVGGKLDFGYFIPSPEVFDRSKYIFAVNPFVNKSTPKWNFRLGLQLLLDRNIRSTAEFHLYPDVNFGFNMVPSYVSFFASLKGELLTNDPWSIIAVNPYIVDDGSLFRLQNTSTPMKFSVGFKGNNGLEGNYLLSASYSLVDNMLFYSNLVFPDSIEAPQMGNYFTPLADDAEILNIHGELTGMIGDKVTFRGIANWYQYTLSKNEYAWNKPEWDANLNIKYNLRNKIIADIDLRTIGEYRLLATRYDVILPPSAEVITRPAHFNMNISAEYRYTKILSVWARINNIAFKRYYEWAFYPTQRFNLMIGFTYSL